MSEANGNNSNETNEDRSSLMGRRRETRAAARAERRGVSATASPPGSPPGRVGRGGSAVTSSAATFSNMSEEERQRRYDEKMAQMGVGADDAATVNTATSSAAATAGTSSSRAPTACTTSNNTRSVPFSNMSEQERQRRYDAKMADMGIVEENNDGDVDTTAAQASVAPVPGHNSARSAGEQSRNTNFSNMSEDERQRRYDSKMAQFEDPANDNDQENHQQDAVSQKILNDAASTKSIAMGSSSGTSFNNINSNNSTTVTTANYGMATAPQVEYGSYEVRQSLREKEKMDEEYPEDDLAIAMAINEEDEEKAMEGNIAYAIEYDPDSKPPLMKNRRFQMYGVIGALLLIVIGAGAGIGVSSGSNDDSSSARSMDAPPTEPPTEFLTAKETKVYDFLSTYFSPKVMEEGTPHRLAAAWSLEQDPLSDVLTEGDLGMQFLQRYALAFLWYHTTENGSKPWRSCNPFEEGAGDTCTFLQWELLANDEVCFKEVEGVNRWMSGEETCRWQGVDCATGNEVLGIDLFWQGLTGTLPTELVALTSLQKVGLAFNELTGTIPSEYASLRTLFSLEVHGNLLTGKIPDAFYEAASETGALVLLNVGDNQLSGILDTRIGQMTDLKGFFFFDNKFTGTIPTEIGNLRYLSFSRGHGNQLSGSLPTELGRVRQLAEFWYHQCGLTGTIPSEIGRMKRMKSFRIWGNELSGPIPEELYEMGSVERFSLQENALTGTISTAVANLVALQEFRVSSNQLDGTIPSELGRLSNLNTVWVHQNDLSGVMPTEVCNSNLVGLQADCDPEGAAAVECDCCSACCEQGLGLGTCFIREGFEEPTLPPNIYDPYVFCEE